MKREMFLGILIPIFLVVLSGVFLWYPNPVSKAIWSGNSNLLQKVIQGELPPNTSTETFRQRILRDHPYSEAALLVRFLQESYDLRDALRYHPESPLLLSELAVRMDHWEPAKAVAYAKKALKLIAHSDESAELSRYAPFESPRLASHLALGEAYQRLGNYKAAVVHLKTAIGQITPEIDSSPLVEAPALSSTLAKEIAAIVSWKSLKGPDPKPQMGTDEHAAVQQEFDDFLKWMQTIENATSPSELDDFLMHEMAWHLQGGDMRFTADRLIRAYETLNHYGETEGILRLKKIDPNIVKAMSKHRLSRSQRTTRK